MANQALSWTSLTTQQPPDHRFSPDLLRKLASMRTETLGATVITCVPMVRETCNWAAVWDSATRWLHAHGLLFSMDLDLDLT